VPELPEVETVRRMLEAVRGRTIRKAESSGKKLRTVVSPRLPRRLRGHRVTAIRRHGKYLLFDLDGGLTLLSHLGMSGRWILFQHAGDETLKHVHLRVEFQDGSQLWFQDARRFGLLRLISTSHQDRDPSLSVLGLDPMVTPPAGAWLNDLARDARVSVKQFLLDQKRIAGIGNIYASEILYRAGIDPRRSAGRLTAAEWKRVATEIPRVLAEAIERMGTTFRTYRTPWDEPGAYGERLLVYDRANGPCRRCRTPIRRILQGQRSTFFCPVCQSGRRGRAPIGPLRRPRVLKKRTAARGMR
jgi:formamidopyrimidine-DNA glycosylase